MEVGQQSRTEISDNGQDHNCDPAHVTYDTEHHDGGATCDAASIRPAASVVAAAAAAVLPADAGCSARGGPHAVDNRLNANKKRSQPFRTPKTKNNLIQRA